MSYCRWSSDDYQCDVYVYAHAGGWWQTNVASRRHEWDVPLPPEPRREDYPEIDPAGSEDWIRVAGQNTEEGAAIRAMSYGYARVTRFTEVTKLLRDESNYHWVDLPEPRDGIDYVSETPGECADLLEDLRSQGFNVPQYAIDALREEQEEMEKR